MKSYASFLDFYKKKSAKEYWIIDVVSVGSLAGWTVAAVPAAPLTSRTRPGSTTNTQDQTWQYHRHAGLDLTVPQTQD